jgi:hypothetical protein
VVGPWVCYLHCGQHINCICVDICLTIYHHTPTGAKLILDFLYDFNYLCFFFFSSSNRFHPFQSVNLVANAVLSPIYLGEAITRLDVIAICCVLVGCSLTVVFGSQATPVYTLDDLFHFYLRLPFIIYSAVIGSVLAILFFVGKVFVRFPVVVRAPTADSDAIPLGNLATPGSQSSPTHQATAEHLPLMSPSRAAALSAVTTRDLTTVSLQEVWPSSIPRAPCTCLDGVYAYLSHVPETLRQRYAIFVGFFLFLTAFYSFSAWS